MKEEITLQLLAEDFKDTVFTNPCCCAISKAFKRQEGFECLEGITDLDVYIEPGSAKTIKYTHQEYNNDDHFVKDKFLANSSEPGQVIRTIKLTLDEH